MPKMKSNMKENITKVHIENISEVSSRDNSSDVGITLKQLLVWVTFLNIVLFLGGTIFTAFKVASIQERYNQAEVKIVEAQKKYSEAKQALDSVTRLEITVKNRLNEIANLSEVRQKQLNEKSRIHSQSLNTILTKSDEQYQLLVQKRADISERMSDYLKETDLELQRAANQLTVKLESDIEVQSTSLELINKDIELVKKNSDESQKLIEGLQNNIDMQLESFKGIEVALIAKLDTLTGRNVVTITHLWAVADIWLKGLLLLPLLALFIIVIIRFIFKKS
jgi:hypothetical protein